MFKRIYIEITNICNLNCSFCPRSTRTKDYMKVNDFEYILNKINNYTDNIYLHIKGEPLMHPYIEDIIKLADKYNLNVNITTNGRLLRDKINIINNNKIRQINISLHSYNSYDDMKEVIELCDSIKDTYVSLRLWNNLDNSKIINYMENKYNIKIDINKNRNTLSKNIFLSTDKEFEWPSMDIPVISTKGTCLALKQQIGILVDGTVVSCCLDNEGDNSLGNIFDNSLEEIIESDKYKSMLEGFNNNKLVSPLCQRCGYIHK